MRAVSNFLVRGCRTYIQCASSVEMAQGKSEEPLLPHRTQTVFHSTSPLLSPPARSVPSFRQDRFEWGREPRGGSWHIPAAALLALGTFAAAASDRVAEAQESPQELSWDDLNEIADLLSIQDRSDVEELKKECFNRAIALCFDRDLSLLPLKKLLLLKGPNHQSFLTTAVHEGVPSEIIRKLAKEEGKHGFYSYDSMGNSPLHYAALHDRYDLIDDLWRYTQHKNQRGQTALHVAIKADLSEFIKRLILKGANRREQWQGLSPLALAVQSGAQKSFKALAPQLSELKQTIPEGGSLLHLAILNGQQEMLEFLLERRTYFKTAQKLLLDEDSEGRTPFALACALGDTEAATFLHQKGGEKTLNQPDPQGWTPAHWAAKNYQWPIIERLGSWGANLEAKDLQGKRPIDMIDGASVEAQDMRTALELAINRQSVGDQSTGFSIKLPVNLVLKGGGPKGIAYIGALKALRERHLDRDLRNVAGTSAGAITAAMIAFGYSPEEMEEELTQKNLLNLLDPKDKSGKAIVNAILEGKKSDSQAWPFLKLLSGGVLHLERTYRELSTTTGLCKGEDARLWFEQLIFKQIRKIIRKEDATDSELRHLTFKQLRELIRQGYPLKHLTICATSLSDQKSVTFSSREPSEYDDLIISDAIRASMSIPGVFEPHTLHYKNARGERLAWADNRRFVDGGLLRNFPITVYDNPFNRETLGLSLTVVDEGPQPPPQTPTNPLELAKAVAMIYFNAEEILLEQDTRNRNRVVEIPVKGVGLLDFDLTKEQQKGLVQAGCDAINSSPLFPERVDRPSSRRRSIETPIPYFSGRIQERELLKRNLLNRQLPWNKQVIVHLISGFPGMGKTELARKVVDEILGSLDDSSYVFELDYSNIDESYRQIAEKIKIYLKDSPNKETIRYRLFAKLEESKEPWFLIVHNVNGIVDPRLFPQSGGHLLITSTTPKAWSNPYTPIALSKLRLDEAVELIAKITGESPSSDMEQLARDLDGFPLAIQQAAYFIRGPHPKGEPNQCTVSEYRRLFSPLNEDETSSNERYPRPLKAVLKITFDQMAKEEPLAWEGLKFFSWFAPEKIPLDYDCKTHDPTSERRKQVSLLRQHGITKEYRQNEWISIHALIQEGARILQSPSEQKESFQKAVKFAIDYFDVDLEEVADDIEDAYFENIEACSAHETIEDSFYFSHLQAITKHAQSLNNENSLEIAQLTSRKGHAYFFAFGDYKSALEKYQLSLKILINLKEVQPEDLCTAYYDVGKAYLHLNLPDQALPFLEEAYKIDKKFNISHSSKARILIECLINLKKLESAHLLILELENKSKSLECKKCAPELLVIKAKYYDAIEDYPSAIKFYKESIEKSEEDEKNPYLWFKKFCLGWSYFKNKDYQLAVTTLQAVLERDRKLYLKSHPAIASSLKAYGKALLAIEEYKKSVDCFIEFIEIKLNSKEQIESISEVYDLSIQCLKKLPFKERQEPLQKIIPLCEACYGKDDPRMAQLQELGREPGFFGTIRSWFSS